MSTTTLTNRLSKMGIGYKVINVNGYDMDIQFAINGITFLAGYNVNSNSIIDFCREICFDNGSQEMQRRFFDNFAQVLRYANNLK